MSRTPNADAFLQRYQEIQREYDSVFEPHLRKIRAKYAGMPGGNPPRSVEDHLEYHERVYVVNALLAALNWRLDASPLTGLPDLTPEAPLRSKERRTVRFLDYLGVESESANPILIVETKRRSAGLPRGPRLATTYSEVVSMGLKGVKLYGEWRQWLADLKDYVQSIHERSGACPRRVVITNGVWIILFLDPEDAFIESGSKDSTRILVFENRADVERRSAELYRALEHRQVLEKVPPLQPGEVLSFLSPDKVERAMHGIHLQYSVAGHFAKRPVITVTPLMFLCSPEGAWVRVEGAPDDYEVSPEYQSLVAHLAEVDRAAKALLARLDTLLGKTLVLQSLQEHYSSEEAFSSMPAIVAEAKDHYVVATGRHTHYILPEPTVPVCPFHDWNECVKGGVSRGPSPLRSRSISPRALFVSGELHHCAHGDVATAKEMPLSALSRVRAGPRSGLEGQAFCEIWRFEQHLCCRTCAFEKVCTKAQVFTLPCQLPAG